jgi:hypothetical protein
MELLSQPLTHCNRSISEDGVFIRQQAGINSEIILTAPQNMPIQLTHDHVITGNLSWLKVKLPFGDIGWVAQKYTSKSKTQIPSWIKPVARVIIADDTNLYEYPSLHSQVIGSVNIGQKLMFSGRKIQNGDNIWLHAESEPGKECWLNQDGVGIFEENIGEYALDKPENENNVLENENTIKSEPAQSSSLSGASNLGDWRRSSDHQRGRLAGLFTKAWSEKAGNGLDPSNLIYKAAELYACISKTAGMDEISADQSSPTDSQPVSDIAALCVSTMGW